MGHHDEEAPHSGARGPANRLGLDYRAVPARKAAGVPVSDIHTHVRLTPSTPSFIEAATAYGVESIVTMSPLAEVDALRAAYPSRRNGIHLYPFAPLS